MRVMSRLMANAVFATALIVAPVLGVVSAGAATIDWAAWSNGYTAGYPSGGSDTATMGSNTVTYSGELLSVVANYPSWGPLGTFNGGTVGNAPPQSGGIVQLKGGAPTPPTDTITFSTAVVNPVMAIWSLGQGGLTASFDFNQPFTIQSGGPSNEYGGGTITQLALSALGAEGNGTIQFAGTFTQISWTNPTNEFWYGFTVGAPVAATPLPAALPLFATGLGAMGLLGWRRKRKNAAALAAA
jgi:hypothetical protein